MSQRWRLRSGGGLVSEWWGGGKGLRGGIWDARTFVMEGAFVRVAVVGGGVFLVFEPSVSTAPYGAVPSDPLVLVRQDVFVILVFSGPVRRDLGRYWRCLYWCRVCGRVFFCLVGEHGHFEAVEAGDGVVVGGFGCLLGRGRRGGGFEAEAVEGGDVGLRHEE